MAVQPILVCPLCQTAYEDITIEFCLEDGARLRSTSMLGTKWRGKALGGYEVKRFLGSGGMAEVYEAQRVADGLPVALKLLRPQVSGDAALVERFRLEAQLIGLIDHPNVIAVHDSGTFDDGTVYIAMELLHGRPLDEALMEGPLETSCALEVARQTCDGLQAAHDKGVVHRDVKPANVYLQQTDAGETCVKVLVKVLDLGIAKLRGSKESNLTAMGMIFGSPEYISPEQALGKEVDCRADIYSLGIMLYQMFTGEVPFLADSFVGVLTKHVSTPPVWPERVARERGLPPALGDVIMKALEKNPEHRQQTMPELRDAVTEALAGEVDVTAPVEPSTAVIEPPRATKELMPLASSGANPDNEVVEIATDTYWVGRREGVVLERNVFLRVYRGGGQQLNVIIDPGPTRDLNTVAAKVKKVIGPLENIDVVFLNHQDPDVAGNAAVIQELNPQVHVICSEDTWRLAQFYGLRKRRYSAVEHFPELSTTLASGHRVTFVPTPYCHFRGAVAYYDRDTRVLFSGDLFGGLSRSLDLVLDREAWTGIEIFHQLYMPSRKALRHAIAGIRALDPAPVMIAPQHGALIREEMIEEVLSWVERLEVGVDLLDRDASAKRYLGVINDIVDDLIDTAGEEAVSRQLRRFSADGSFPNLFVFDGAMVREIKIEPRAAFRAFLDIAAPLAPKEQLAELAEKRLEQHGVRNLTLPGLTPEPYLEYVVE